MYTKAPNGDYIATEKAPPEAVKTIEKLNELARRDEERHEHSI